jgi:hypothetical protein
MIPVLFWTHEHDVIINKTRLLDLNGTTNKIFDKLVWKTIFLMYKMCQMYQMYRCYYLSTQKCNSENKKSLFLLPTP